MPDFEEKREPMIEHLEAALADELRDSVTGYLIKTALDQARADFIARDHSGGHYPASPAAAYGARGAEASARRGRSESR